ncbi:MAG: hypothetical protein IPO94_13260 [Saprospiraceae bacterium]|nr:hypothetical protein [Saprospiraceae bacterium]
MKGYSTESVTQHVFASILAINNKVEYYNNAVKEGRWSNCPDFCFFDQPIFELSGSTLGIIGYGAIGKRVGEVALAFGMKVLVFTRNTNQTKQANLEFCDLETLFSNADVLTLHCPLTDDTKEIVNKHNLSLMKPSAILINTGRVRLDQRTSTFLCFGSWCDSRRSVRCFDSRAAVSSSSFGTASKSYYHTAYRLGEPKCPTNTDYFSSKKYKNVYGWPNP